LEIIEFERSLVLGIKGADCIYSFFFQKKKRERSNEVGQVSVWLNNGKTIDQ
jgi:hypothetical protein